MNNPICILRRTVDIWVVELYENGVIRIECKGKRIGNRSMYAAHFRESEWLKGYAPKRVQMVINRFVRICRRDI